MQLFGYLCLLSVNRVSQNMRVRRTVRGKQFSLNGKMLGLPAKIPVAESVMTYACD